MLYSSCRIQEIIPLNLTTDEPSQNKSAVRQPPSRFVYTLLAGRSASVRTNQAPFRPGGLVVILVACSGPTPGGGTRVGGAGLGQVLRLREQVVGIRRCRGSKEGGSL